MKNRMAKLHPVSVLVFFTQALVICFCAETAQLSVMFALLFVNAVLQKKAKTLLWSLPLAGFMLVLNPLFYHGGKTVLFHVGDINFTLEAVENGLYCALLILCTMLLFTVFGNVLGEEKFLYTFGAVFPKIALMISMIFKHFDLLSNAYEQTKNMAKMNGIYENDKTLWQKLKTNAVIFEAFTGAALEGSIDTALSLSAKGYYSKHKTRIKHYRFTVADGLFIAICSAVFAVTFLKLPFSAAAVGVFFLIPILLGYKGVRQ